jgi:transposase, IS5 family
MARWMLNPYLPVFCGMTQFQWELLCDPSELVYFRRHIGEGGVALILSLSARLDY